MPTSAAPGKRRSADRIEAGNLGVCGTLCTARRGSGPSAEEEKRDAKRPPHSRRVLTAAEQQDLAQGHLRRGELGQMIDTRTPSERSANGTDIVARDFGMDYATLAKRWDNQTRQDFEGWAGKQAVSRNGINLLAWLKGERAAPAQPASLRALAEIEGDLTNLHRRWEDMEMRLKITADPEERQRLHERMQALLEKGREAVEIPHDQRGKVRFSGKRPSKPVMKVVNQGAEIAQRYTHSDLLPETEAKVSRGGRAFCRGRTVHVSSKTSASVAAHEITHATEKQNPQVLKASRDFLKKRAGGAPAKSLRTLTGINYRSDEVAFEDEWEKRGGDLYSGKDYGERATEILTMGIERLHRNPALFLATDPEYFRFVLNTLQQR